MQPDKQQPFYLTEPGGVDRTGDALLPCPWCGHVGLMFEEGSTFRWRVASCERCGVTTGEERIQTMGDGTREEWEADCRKRMIAAWNRRAAPPQAQEHQAEPLAPTVPDGWVIVPREPTREMIAAYLKANDAYWVRTDETPLPLAKWRAGTPAEATAEGYTAMIAAAPPTGNGVQPDAWLHTVKQHGGDGTEDLALSFNRDSFPLQGVEHGMFYSVACAPLYRREQ